jgi:hypothetical protein
MEETEEGGSSRLTSLAQSTISLTCRANGQPSPNITWTKEAKRYRSHISSLSNIKSSQSLDQGLKLSAGESSGLAISYECRLPLALRFYSTIELSTEINFRDIFS